eukprot:10215440-Ditylum_brightwellii.AAC.1
MPELCAKDEESDSSNDEDSDNEEDSEDGGSTGVTQQQQKTVSWADVATGASPTASPTRNVAHAFCQTEACLDKELRLIHKMNNQARHANRKKQQSAQRQSNLTRQITRAQAKLARETQKDESSGDEVE